MESCHQRDKQQLLCARSSDNWQTEQLRALRELHAVAADARDPFDLARARRAEQPAVRARVASARAAPLVEHLPGRHRARGPRLPARLLARVHRGARRAQGAQLPRGLPALQLALPHVPVHPAAPPHRLLRRYFGSYFTLNWLATSEF